MSWAKLLAAFVRFITWRARLNRVQFGVGFAATCFGGTLVVQIIAFAIAIAIALGSLEALFDQPQLMFPLFVPMILVAWALLAGRAHDLGWPGWPFVALYVAPFAPWVVVMDQVFGFFEGAVFNAVSEHVSLEMLLTVMFASVGLFWLAFVALAAMPGQQKVNRYGEQPASGLHFG